MDEEKKPVYTFGNVPKGILEMDEELNKIEKQEQEQNLKVIKERNKKARSIIDKFSKPVDYEVDGIIFTLKPITVKSWDLASEDGRTRDDPLFQSMVVKDSLLSPELSDTEFDLLPAGIKYKLFVFLIADFFLMAGKVVRKE